MSIEFEYPIKIKQFAKKEGIKIEDIQGEILSVIDEDLLDKNYKPIKYDKIRIVINGIHRTQKNKLFISPNKISKKKPLLKTASISGNKYTLYYLIFKEK